MHVEDVIYLINTNSYWQGDEEKLKALLRGQTMRYNIGKCFRSASDVVGS